MTTTKTISLAVVGLADRGLSMLQYFQHLPQFRLSAICDINPQVLKAATEKTAPGATYTDFTRMLDETKPDALYIATPMPLHAPQAIEALKRDIHVLSDVPAGVSIEECRRLVEAANASKATYMFGENYNLTKPIQIVKEMVRQGVFGEVYYAEGEYIHEIKQLGEKTPWRLEWGMGIDGVTYGTHSLGPILHWFEGQRVERVCCAGSGVHYKDPRGKPYAQDTSVMLCQMTRGGLAKIRLDIISDRPQLANGHQLQGTDGCYESRRGHEDGDRFWLRSECGEKKNWLSINDVAEKFMPPLWAKYGDLVASSGHGGGDMLQLIEFADAIIEGRPPIFGIHEGMDMTLPGLISQQSIKQKGAWLDVPDSRTW